MTDFTVVIPTYNGAERVSLVLERLRSQTQVDTLQWEILVVDNNSQDDTATVIQQYQQAWSICPLRYVLEPQQGLAFARQCALANAQSDLIGFIDDDVLVVPDWVSMAYRFSQTHPKAGAYGGQIHGDYEVEPPDNFRRIQSFVAIREGGDEPRRYQPETLSLPPGAALVVRRQAWLMSVPDVPLFGGRVNNSLVAGDDYEVLIHLHRSGWEIWYNPAMHVYHQIPKRRLEASYLIKLSRGCGLAVYSLRQLTVDTPGQRLLMALRTVAGNLRRALLHLLKYQQAVFTDLVARCEMVFLLSSAISPLYGLWSSFQRNLMVLQETLNPQSST